MPEFHLDYGTPEAARVYASLDEFTQGYIEAMFFTDCNTDCEDLTDASFAELAPETLERIKRNCERFQTEHAALLEQAYGQHGKHERSAYDATKAGRDFWYTSNGHGTGFWDRGLEAIGDALTEASKHPSVATDLYRGDDELIYIG
jgi:hypothetical protein